LSRLRKDKEGGETVQSVSRALSLIETMSRADGPVSLSELSKKAHLTLTTTHRLLSTLLSRGFAAQDPTTLKYYLGIKTFEIGNAALIVNDLRTLARPFLKRLAESVNETINLAILDETEVVYIDQLESTNMVVVKMIAGVGSRSPAYCTGSGKVLLADLPANELRQRLSKIRLIKFTKYTNTDIEQLIELLAEVNRQGYALDFSERDLGVTCVAVPVKNFEGKVQAAISVSAPAQRITAKRIHEEILPVLSDVSSQVSRQLGFRY
jgi:DNA-binding IclR family transcriptional regulator